MSAQKIIHIVDVRTIPKSRHVPWFNHSKLKLTLQRHNIAYTHIPALRGLRRTTADFINTGWRNASFRGFADYMQTVNFFAGLKELNHLIKKGGRIAIMCAEALPWHCHRSLIADAETVRHVTVWEIISKHSLHLHKLTAFAVVDRSKNR